jgi:hypothetical protein
MAKETEATETKEVAKLSEVDTLKKELQAYKDEYRTLKTENNELKSIHAPQYAEMKLQLEMAKQLIASKAFPNVTPEQAFVILQAGKEMGLKPMQSIKSLYIVKGAISFFGSGLVARITDKGYKVQYTEETDKGVTVIISKDNENYTEVVKDTDQILQKSEAIKFAKKNKMRYHGVKMIASFYLPHIVGSVGIWDDDDMDASKEEKKGEEFQSISDMIQNADSQEMLDDIFATNKKAISKSLELTMLVGKKKKEFLNLKAK